MASIATMTISRLTTKYTHCLVRVLHHLTKRPEKLSGEKARRKFYRIYINFVVKVTKRLFQYSASKSTLLPYILPTIPPHNVYIEPFVGSGTVFFNKEPAMSEILNDKNDLIVTVYRVVQDYSKFRKFVRMMSCMMHSDSEYRRAAEIIINRQNYDDVTLAYAVCVRINLSYLHDLELRHKNCVVNVKRHKHCWLKPDFYKELLPFLHKRLQNAQITCRDAFDVIKTFDKPEAFIFIDPPYLNTATKLCDINSAKETASAEFHRELLKVIKNVKGKVMITSFVNDLYESELRDWRKVYVKRKALLKVQATRGGEQKELVEVIYINYEPPAGMSGEDFGTKIA